MKSLEDLIVWQEARILMRLVYKLTAKFPGEEKFNLVKHMRACSRNIPANIAEGFGRFHYQESMQFNRIARGSLMELKSDIYSSYDCNYINRDELDKLLEQITLVHKLLNAFIKSTYKIKNTNS
ncbi:hypothetical protein A2V71_00225 [Candidatus Berkelbacteria bacterium RBG_13_40_8]|uniref:Four helix bundle protein n=1 Tax=Candidatus Berkelbacteria bacterium RBG_13_40_8 TaxID=1797467 RepID=A0A1F5DN90_9BACT|nr:MAG: hypothetical protein A2V71_00225 [Candidatus Berkelbacteria bacterium RBG_13_40_8]